MAVTCPICQGHTQTDDCLCSGFGWLVDSAVQDSGYHDELIIWEWRIRQAIVFLRAHGYQVSERPQGQA